MSHIYLYLRVAKIMLVKTEREPLSEIILFADVATFRNDARHKIAVCLI
jgi:hypothetical protein